MTDPIIIITEIENEYTKLFTSCKKKYSDLKSEIENNLNFLSELKNLSKNTILIEFKKNFDKILSPLLLTAKLKLKNLFINDLNIIQKIFEYKIFPKNFFKKIFKFFNEIFYYKDEIMIIKILEIFELIVNKDIIIINEELISIFWEFILKIWVLNKNIYKDLLSKVIKGLYKVVFKFLYDMMNPIVEKKKKEFIIISNQNNEIINNKENNNIIENNNNNDNNNINNNISESNNNNINENNNIIENEDNNNNIINDNNNNNNEEQEENNNKIEEKKENDNNNNNNLLIDMSLYENIDIIKCSYYLLSETFNLINQKKSRIIYITVCSKCLGLELLNIIIQITKDLLLYLPKFNEKIIELKPILKSIISTKKNDFFTSLKISRLIIIIIKNFNFNNNNNDYIETINNFINNSDITKEKYFYNKLIAIESLSLLIKDKNIIFKLFNEFKEIYKNLFNIINKITYACILNNSGNIINNNNNKDNENKNIMKIDDFFFDFENNVAPYEINNKDILFSLIEFYVNLFETYLNIFKDVNDNNYDNKKEIIEFNYSEILKSIIALCHYIKDDENNNNNNNIENNNNNNNIENNNNNNENISKNIENENNSLNENNNNNKNGYLDKLINLIKVGTSLFNDLKLFNIRDEYLTEIYNNINIDNNNEDENNNNEYYNEIFEKKLMLNFFEIYNENVFKENIDNKFIDKSIEIFQKIYYKIIKSDNNLLLNPTEEYELDVYIKYIETFLKEYINIDIKDLINNKDNFNNKENSENDNNENEENNNNNEINENNKNDNINTPSQEVNSNFNIFSLFNKINPFSKFSHNNNNNNENINNNELLTQKLYFKTLKDKIGKLYLIQCSSQNLLSLIYSSLYDNTKYLCENNIEKKIYFLHFNLTKFFELSLINYSNLFDDNNNYNIFINSVELISKQKLKIINHYSIDILTLTIYFIIILYKNEINEDLLFNSLLIIANKNISQEINLNIIYDLNILLINISHLIDYKGFNKILEIFFKLIIYNDEAQSENVFSIIENIIKNNNNIIKINNYINLIEIIEIFISYKKNINISIESLNLLKILSDIIENNNNLIYVLNNNNIKYDINNNNNNINDSFFIENKDIESRQKFFENIWKNFFDKIINLSLDEREDINKNVIENFTEIFCNKCKLISPDTGVDIIKNYYEVFKKIYNIYEEKIEKEINKFIINNNNDKNNNENDINNNNNNKEDEIKIGNFVVTTLQLPKKKNDNNNSENDSNSEEENNNNNNDLNNKLDSKQWENSLLITLKSISKIITNYLLINPNLGYEYYINNIFNSYLETLKIKYYSPLIIINILKSFNEILNCNKNLFYYYFENFILIFNQINLFITNDKFIFIYNHSNNKNFIINLINEIKILFFSNLEITFKENNFIMLINIVKNILKCVKLIEKKFIKKFPFKIHNNEKIIFNFVNEILIKMNNNNYNNNNNLNNLANFYSSYLYIDLNNLHSEILCKVNLNNFVNFFKSNLPFKFIKNYLPTFINNCRDLILLKNQPDYVYILMGINENNNNNNKNNNKNYANNFDINSYITNNNTINNENDNIINIETEKNKIYIWKYSNDILIQILTYIITNKNNNNNTNNLNEIFSSLISSYDLIFNQTSYQNIQKNYKENLIKSIQEMEIDIIQFIVKILLPHSLYINKELQMKLLNLLDMGSNFNYSNSNNSNYNSSNGNNNDTSSISKVCISNLFELCRYKNKDDLIKELNSNNNNSITNNDYINIKIKIAKMCTPILIKRCKEILKKYMEDEIKSGSMPLSRSRLEDCKFVLEKLKDLEIFPNDENEDNVKENNNNNKNNDDIKVLINKKRKSHLINLLPLLSDFITTKENEIKIIVKEMFKIIAEQLGIK